MKECTCLFRNPALHLDVNCPIHGTNALIDHSVKLYPLHPTIENVTKQHISIVIEDKKYYHEDTVVIMLAEYTQLLEEKNKLQLELIKRLRIDIYNRLQMIKQHSMFDSLTESLNDIDKLIR